MFGLAGGGVGVGRNDGQAVCSAYQAPYPVHRRHHRQGRGRRLGHAVHRYRAGTGGGVRQGLTCRSTGVLAVRSGAARRGRVTACARRYHRRSPQAAAEAHDGGDRSDRRRTATSPSTVGVIRIARESSRCRPSASNPPRAPRCRPTPTVCPADAAGQRHVRREGGRPGGTATRGGGAGRASCRRSGDGDVAVTMPGPDGMSATVTIAATALDPTPRSSSTATSSLRERNSAP